MPLPLGGVMPGLDIHAEKGHHLNQIFGHLKKPDLSRVPSVLEVFEHRCFFVCVIRTTINKNNDNADL